ncbi:MAG TPA: response regulator [Sumerlaeia bacterium]|nr:response regulator [Sumerlaeia bacterium]
MGKSVVIIEDDADLAEIMRTALETKGVLVHTASDGPTGLEMVRKKRPDAVILDIVLPKMNGYEVCTAIQQDSRLSHTPITVITGVTESSGSVSDELWRKRLDVADFVSKPFDAVELAERLAKSLGTS